MENLNDYRARLDAIDKDMVALFEARMHMAYEIGRYKKAQGLPVLDEKREAEKLEKVSELVKDKNLEGEIRKFYQYLMERSRNAQNEL